MAAFTVLLYRFASWAEHPDKESSAGLALDVQLDLQWWAHILSTASPHVCFDDVITVPTVHIWVDASNYGYGGYCPQAGEFVRGQWLPHEQDAIPHLATIGHREMAMVVFGVATWMHRAAGGRIVVHCDNEGDCTGLQHLSFHDLRLRMFMRLLSVMQIHTRAWMTVQHVSGVQNRIADHLSRHPDTPPAIAHYTQRHPPDMIRTFSSELLTTWLQGPSTAPDQITRTFERLSSIASTLASGFPSILRWTTWNAEPVPMPPQPDDDCTTSGGS
jgi:hypothetical protein